MRHYTSRRDSFIKTLNDFLGQASYEEKQDPSVNNNNNDQKKEKKEKERNSNSEPKNTSMMNEQIK